MSRILSFQFRGLLLGVCVCWWNYLCRVFSSCWINVNSVWFTQKMGLQLYAKENEDEKSKWNKPLIKSFINKLVCYCFTSLDSNTQSHQLCSSFFSVFFHELQNFGLLFLALLSFLVRFTAFSGKPIRGLTYFRSVFLLLLVSPALPFSVFFLFLLHSFPLFSSNWFCQVLV